VEDGIQSTAAVVTLEFSIGFYLRSALPHQLRRQAVERFIYTRQTAADPQYFYFAALCDWRISLITAPF
jgi:hypothetical protein